MKRIILLFAACSIILSGCSKIRGYIFSKIIGPARFFNMDKIQDESTLKTKVIRNEVIDSTARKGKKIRVIELTFFSQNWHDSIWEHRARIYVPENYTPDGNVGIIGTHIGFFDQDEYERRTIPGTTLNTEAEYCEGTALDLGIPIMIFSNPPARIFGMHESDMMGHGLKKLKETKDMSWFPYVPIVRSYLRAITLMQSLPAVRAERAVLMGCSKRGYSVSLATGVDPERVAGIMATCFYGGNHLYWISMKFAQFGPGIGGPAEKREGPGYQPAAKLLDTFNNVGGFFLIMAFDPYIWRDKIQSSYLVALGTNDEFYALGTPNGMMSKFEGDKAFLYIDNLPHSWVSQKHLAAWRMWLAHNFYGRKVPAVEMKSDFRGQQVVVTAVVTSPNTVKSVRLFRAYNPTNDWRFVKWFSIPMRGPEGEKRGVLAIKEGMNLAYYVEVEDFHEKGGTGYVSSLVELVRK